MQPLRSGETKPDFLSLPPNRMLFQLPQTDGDFKTKFS